MAEYIVSADTVSGCVTGNNCDYQKKGLFQMKNVMFQIKYDFINGIVHQWKKFLLIAVVYAVLITDFLVRCKTKHFMGHIHIIGYHIIYLSRDALDCGCTDRY